MKAIVLTARFPYPADRGDRVTSHEFIRALAREHQVTLVSFTDGTEAPGVQEAMRPLCERIETVELPRTVSWRQAFLGLAGDRPSQVCYYDSPKMHELVSRLVREVEPDVVVAHLFRMAQFVESIDHPRKVLFMADSLALSLRRSLPFQPVWKRPAIAWEAYRVARYEPKVGSTFRENWVLSDVDLADLKGRGTPRLRRVRLGVDDRLFDLELASPEAPRVLFLGNLSVPHNIDSAFRLARELWPRIRSECPQATLELAGADPIASIRALDGTEGISVPGALPDLRPVWQRASVMVAPLRFSAGIQNKILEAMAAGVPVVTTPGAAEAILARDGVHLSVAETDEGLAAATLAVLRAPDFDPTMRRTAREYVRQHFSWQALVRRLEELAADPAARAGEPAGPEGV